VTLAKNKMKQNRTTIITATKLGWNGCEMEQILFCGREMVLDSIQTRFCLCFRALKFSIL
jgi:hypothetical protein